MTYEFDVRYLQHQKFFPGKIRLTQIAHGETLLEYTDNNGSWRDKDVHLFASFCRLRKYLNERGQVLLCKGCRKNVHPVGGQLGWIYAQVLSMNVPIVRHKDEVIIFDEELEIDQLVSVEEQTKFYYEWWKSVTGHSLDRISIKSRVLSFFSSLKNIFNKRVK